MKTTINSVETAVLDGIAGELGGTTRVVEEADLCGNKTLLLRVNSHCSFSLRDGKLIKNCEAELAIDLANPNYLSVLKAAVKYCDHWQGRCDCSSSAYNWTRIVSRINAKA